MKQILPSFPIEKQYNFLKLVLYIRTTRMLQVLNHKKELYSFCLHNQIYKKMLMEMLLKRNQKLQSLIRTNTYFL